MKSASAGEYFALVLAALVLLIVLVSCFMCIQLYRANKPGPPGAQAAAARAASARAETFQTPSPSYAYTPPCGPGAPREGCMGVTTGAMPTIDAGPAEDWRCRCRGGCARRCAGGGAGL